MHDRPSVADHRGGQLPTAGLAGGSCAAADHGAARARPRAVAGAGAYLARRRTTPRCSRSATWSAPTSTSSPTARCAAKATPTASPPRSTASTTITPRPSPTGPAARSTCRAWSARCGARARSRSATWNSSAATPTRQAKITLPGPFTMAQQAKNDFYKDADEMVMDFAAAVNEEAHDLAGRRRRRDPDRRSLAPQRSRRRQAHRGARARPRAGGVKVPTVVHLCFGYGAVVPKDKPVGYSFLPQLAGSAVDQMAVEAAQPKLDLSMLKDFSDEDHRARRDRPRPTNGRDARRWWPAASVQH